MSRSVFEVKCFMTPVEAPDWSTWLSIIHGACIFRPPVLWSATPHEAFAFGWVPEMNLD